MGVFITLIIIIANMRTIFFANCSDSLNFVYRPDSICNTIIRKKAQV